MMKVRHKGIVVVSAFVFNYLNVMGGTQASVDGGGGVAGTGGVFYENLLDGFTGKVKILWRTTLQDAIFSRKNDIVGDCGLILEGDWAHDQSVYTVTVKNHKAVSARALGKDGKVSDVHPQQLFSDPDQVAIMSHNGILYLVVPHALVEAIPERPLGKLLFGSLYEFCRVRHLGLPERDFSLLFEFSKKEKYTVRDVDFDETVCGAKMCDVILQLKNRRIGKEWKKSHEMLVRALPRHPPVKYGNVRRIVRQIDDSFIIPRTAPPTTKTIKWKETVWAHGSGWSSSGERVDVDVPVGEVERSRTKKLTTDYDYDELVEKMKKYEEQVRMVKEDRPQFKNATDVRDELKAVRRIKFLYKP